VIIFPVGHWSAFVSSSNPPEPSFCASEFLSEPTVSAIVRSELFFFFLVIFARLSGSIFFVSIYSSGDAPLIPFGMHHASYDPPVRFFLYRFFLSREPYFFPRTRMLLSFISLFTQAPLAASLLFSLSRTVVFSPFRDSKSLNSDPLFFQLISLWRPSGIRV